MPIHFPLEAPFVVFRLRFLDVFVQRTVVPSFAKSQRQLVASYLVTFGWGRTVIRGIHMGIRAPPRRASWGSSRSACWRFPLIYWWLSGSRYLLEGPLYSLLAPLVVVQFALFSTSVFAPGCYRAFQSFHFGGCFQFSPIHVALIEMTLSTSAMNC